MRRKPIAVALASLALASGLAACSKKADVVSHNISNAADNFQVLRHIVVTDTITNTYLLEVIGLCNIGNDSTSTEVNFTCEVKPGQYIKDFVGLSYGVTYVVDQVKPNKVSDAHFTMNYRPETLIPDIDIN